MLVGIGCNFGPGEIKAMIDDVVIDSNDQIDIEEFIAVMKSRKKKIKGVDYLSNLSKSLKNKTKSDEKEEDSAEAIYE